MQQTWILPSKSLSSNEKEKTGSQRTINKAGYGKCKKRDERKFRDEWHPTGRFYLSWLWADGELGGGKENPKNALVENVQRILLWNNLRPWMWSKTGAYLCVYPPCWVSKWLNIPPGFLLTLCVLGQDTCGPGAIFRKGSYYDKLTSRQNSNIYHCREKLQI